jgi:hypothetical protein
MGGVGMMGGMMGRRLVCETAAIDDAIAISWAPRGVFAKKTIKCVL